MRFSSISIHLLNIFRIISFVFDLKYLSQNSIYFYMLGGGLEFSGRADFKTVPGFVFRATFEGDFKVFHCCRCCLPPLYLGRENKKSTLHSTFLLSIIFNSMHNAWTSKIIKVNLGIFWNFWEWFPQWYYLLCISL